MAAGQYYLIQEAAGATPTLPLPTPDATGTIPMSATNGKVALLNTITALTGATPSNPSIIDLVGFGTANFYEGTAAAPAPSNSTGIFRANNGCIDNNQNSTDFSTGTPNPRNTSSPINLCSSNTITTTTLSSATFNLSDCFTTATGTVDFTSTGTYTSNTYSAELSNAAGSFASPVTIGTLVSDANSGTINFIIPAGTATGTLYKIRVVSSSPIITGTSSTDISINQSGSCSSSASDYFRTKASGTWNAVGVWQSSPTGTAGTWINATLTPTSTANTITIRNGHNVTANASVTINQTVIESGGVLINQMATSNILTIADDGSSAYDLEIKSGGIYHVLSTLGYSNYQTINAGATIVIRTGGIIRLGDGTIFAGSGNHQLSATSTTYVWDDASAFQNGTLQVPASSGIIFFPDANATTIPVLELL